MTIPILIISFFFLMQGCVNPSHPQKIKQEIKVETLSKTTSSWNGNTLAPYPKGQPEITILKITIPPYTKIPMHTHPIISGGIILEGELKVTTKDNKVNYLKTGDAIVEVVNTWHYGENLSDKPTQILAFYAGIKGTPLTIKE